MAQDVPCWCTDAPTWSEQEIGPGDVRPGGVNWAPATRYMAQTDSARAPRSRHSLRVARRACAPPARRDNRYRQSAAARTGAPTTIRAAAVYQRGIAAPPRTLDAGRRHRGRYR